MIQREAEYPVSPDELWRAVTQPEHLAEWFGGLLDWEPTPGSPFTFIEDDGARWSGVVTDVDPGRSLRFTWWPEEDPHDASTVGFEIEETPDGSGLRITETPTALVAQPRHWGRRASSLAAMSRRFAHA
jgi:uncharacterized protein YndB with AHSA1/START domain